MTQSAEGEEMTREPVGVEGCLFRSRLSKEMPPRVIAGKPVSLLGNLQPMTQSAEVR